MWRNKNRPEYHEVLPLFEGFYMAQPRKDLRGRVLRKGESQRRSDERYVYTDTDPLGRRKYVSAQDFVTFREKRSIAYERSDGRSGYLRCSQE